MSQKASKSLMETVWSSNCNALLGFVEVTVIQELGGLWAGSLDLFFIALFSDICFLSVDMMMCCCRVGFDDEV